MVFNNNFSTSKSLLLSILLISATLSVSLLIIEGALRLKNSDGRNYHIEMWKYSRNLKTISSNPVLGHEHIPNSSAVLQNVEIRINSDGMRGDENPPIREGQRRILLLGSSATLGWGVEESEIMSAVIQKKLKKMDTVVMNQGIGNYNTKRYVELFLTKNFQLAPTDIIVNYYPNDAEIIPKGGGNFFIRNSELAVTFWILKNRLFNEGGESSLFEHYKGIYDENYAGYQEMEIALKRLSDYANKKDIKLYLMMMPELNRLDDYKYLFIHDKLRALSQKHNYEYIEVLPELQKIKNTTSLWAMAGDPHPNAIAHRIFGEKLSSYLSRQ